MSLPHFFTTMAFFKTTKTLFFLNMAQIKCLCHFLYPIKRVTLFRHVLWTTICGLVMLWWGTVMSRCVTVLHFFMTKPHLHMSTTSFHMTNPHIKWLLDFFCAWVISTYANVVSHMYLFIFFFSPCHFLCWLWLNILWLCHILSWTWRKHKWIRLFLLWLRPFLWLCQKKFVAQSFIFVPTSLHFPPTSFVICTPWQFSICMCHKNYDCATFTYHHDQNKMTVHRNVLTLAHINDYVSFFFDEVIFFYANIITFFRLFIKLGWPCLHR